MSPTSSVQTFKEPWKINILIVDDSQMDREWIAGQAKSMDEYECVVAMASGIDDARALAKAQPFDVALIDYQLGGVRGDTVVQLLAVEQPRCATILVSGHAMSEVSLFGVRAGASAAISKDDLNSTLLETTIRFAIANTARRHT